MFVCIEPAHLKKESLHKDWVQFFHSFENLNQQLLNIRLVDRCAVTDLALTVLQSKMIGLRGLSVKLTREWN